MISSPSDPSKLESDFGEVQFLEVAETNLTDTSLACKFVLHSLKPMSHADRVGLFRVGWVSVQDGLCSISVDQAQLIDAGNARDVYAVKFEAQSLPSDDGEFYQFCYVSAAGEDSKDGGQVRGVSTPFQFIDDDFEILDQPQSMMDLDTEDTAPVSSSYVRVDEKQNGGSSDVTDGVDAIRGASAAGGVTEETDKTHVEHDRLSENVSVTQTKVEESGQVQGSVIQSGVDEQGKSEVNVREELCALKEQYALTLISLKNVQESEKALREELQVLQTDHHTKLTHSEEEMKCLNEALESKNLDIDKLKTQLEASQTEAQTTAKKLAEAEASLSALVVAKDSLVERSQRFEREKEEVSAKLKSTLAEMTQLKNTALEFRRGSAVESNANTAAGIPAWTCNPSATVGGYCPAPVGWNVGSNAGSDCGSIRQPRLMFSNPYAAEHGPEYNHLGREFDFCS